MKEFKLDIPGDMTIYEAAETKELFEKALSDNDDINVNLTNVSEIDSAGLQLMVSLKNAASKSKKTVTYVAHSQAVIDLLDLFNMSSHFGDPVVMKK